jgi:hypothetical protein
MLSQNDEASLIMRRHLGSQPNPGQRLPWRLLRKNYYDQQIIIEGTIRETTKLIKLIIDIKLDVKHLIKQKNINLRYNTNIVNVLNSHHAITISTPSISLPFLFTLL